MCCITEKKPKTSKERIEELEKRVRELECRPIYVSAPMIPQRVTPFIYPERPWWEPLYTPDGTQLTFRTFI